MLKPLSPRPDPMDRRVVPRLRGQLRRPPLPGETGGAAQRGLVLGAGGGILGSLATAARLRAQGGDARAGLAVLRGRRLREVSLVPITLLFKYVKEARDR